MISFAVFLATRATRHYCVAVGAAAVASAYVTAWLSARTTVWTVVVLVAVSAGVVIGYLYHLLANKLRLAGADDAYLLLVSLAVFGVISALSDAVGQGRGAMSPWLVGFDIVELPASRVATFALRLGVIGVALVLWVRADLGIELRALGEDRHALALRGVNVSRLERLSVLAAFAVAAIEGILLTIDGQVTPERMFTGTLWGVAILLAMQLTRERFVVLCGGAVAIAVALSVTPYVVEGDWSIAISVGIVAVAAMLAGRTRLGVA